LSAIAQEVSAEISNLPQDQQLKVSAQIWKSYESELLPETKEVLKNMFLK
jgi:hypothetical protein